MLGGDPGNAILLNGVLQTANREIGAPSQRENITMDASKGCRVGLLGPKKEIPG
jgi:hypothetical protein